MTDTPTPSTPRDKAPEPPADNVIPPLSALADAWRQYKGRDKAPEVAMPELPFVIECRGGTHVLDWSARGSFGCRPATTSEVELWVALRTALAERDAAQSLAIKFRGRLAASERMRDADKRQSALWGQRLAEAQRRIEADGRERDVLRAELDALRRPVDEAGERERFEAWMDARPMAVRGASYSELLEVWLARSRLARRALTWEEIEDAWAGASDPDKPEMSIHDFACAIMKALGIEPPSSGTGGER